MLVQYCCGERIKKTVAKKEIRSYIVSVQFNSVEVIFFLVCVHCVAVVICKLCWFSQLLTILSGNIVSFLSTFEKKKCFWFVCSVLCFCLIFGLVSCSLSSPPCSRFHWLYCINIRNMHKGTRRKLIQYNILRQHANVVVSSETVWKNTYWFADIFNF